MKECDNIFMRCDDNAETVVFSKFKWNDGTQSYEISVEDSYCGGDYMGIKGRLKRAWRAFWKKPICYTGVYTDDKERMKKFLEDCLSLMSDNEK